MFPCVAGEKLPLLKAFPVMASRDPATLEKWSRKYPNSNWGISTTRFGDDQALLVVDVDVKAGKDGNATMLGLELAGFDLPLTLENATPTGGRHLVYTVDAPVKQGVDVLGSGLDIRSQGGYIVGPGSVVPLGEYFTDRPCAPVAAPAWLIERCGTPRTRSANREPNARVDSARAEARALTYLATAPEAIQGAGGDQTTFIVAARLKDLGLTQAAAAGLMLSEHWFDGCGWDSDELIAKVANAWQYGDNEPGADAPEAVFDKVPEAEASTPSAGGHPFDELNRDWALVMTGGGHHMLWETTDFKGQPMIEHVKEGTFHTYLAAREFQVGKKTEKLTQAWMASPRRRTYDGLVFAPAQEVSNRWYNLWRGFDYTPVASDSASPRAAAAVQSWVHHCIENIAQGDKALGRWFIGYMAHLIQKPYDKPLVALVLKGRKGTGKNAALERVGALFKRNMVVADDDRYLIGNFNSHLEACLMLVLDEASWAGSKRVEGKLKGIITGANHMIERKGMEPYQVANLTRVCILGNEDYLVPATQDERRYAVFDVGENSMQDRSFFREMREGMEANGGEGYGLLLDYLQRFDMTGIDVNDAPQTQGLANQKIQHQTPQVKWWADCLEEGQIMGGDFAGDWPENVATNRLQEAFHRYAQSRGIKSWMPTKQAFNKAMAEIMPGWTSTKTTKSATSSGDATRHYVLPLLGAARAAMDAYTGSTEPWGEE